jgi:sulfide:quinone oxidoreductase
MTRNLLTTGVSHMAIHELNASISAADQIAPDQIADIAKLGFKSIVCNRPDGESADQPLFGQIEAAAQAAGLDVAYLPVVAGQITDEHAHQFEQLMAQLPQPILAYCRTGTRSTILWSLAQAKKMSVPDILRTAGQAGYDMSAIVGRIEALQK